MDLETRGTSGPEDMSAMMVKDVEQNGELSAHVRNVKSELGPNYTDVVLADISEMEDNNPDSNNKLLPEHRGMFSETGLSSFSQKTEWKLSTIKSNMEDKARLLSSSWNDLYKLLSEYKSELFSQQTFIENYRSVSDSAQLKTELLQKDNDLRDRDREIGELRDQIGQLQSHVQQCQMDLQVKDSLLRKYQQDLLEKDSSILTSSTKIRRLENCLKALEASASEKNRSPPRKAVKSWLTSSSGLRRSTHEPAACVTSPAKSRQRPRVVTQVSESRVESQPARAATPPQPECIHLDDDIELVEVKTEMDDVYAAGTWAPQMEPPATDPHDLPGSSSLDLRNDSSNLEDHNDPPDPWPVEMNPASSNQPGVQSAASDPKDLGVARRVVHQCSMCGKQFGGSYPLKRHILARHLQLRPYSCALCGTLFAHRYHATRHIRSKHGIMLDPARHVLDSRTAFISESLIDDKLEVSPECESQAPDENRE